MFNLTQFDYLSHSIYQLNLGDTWPSNVFKYFFFLCGQKLKDQSRNILVWFVDCYVGYCFQCSVGEKKIVFKSQQSEMVKKASMNSLLNKFSDMLRIT